MDDLTLLAIESLRLRTIWPISSFSMPNHDLSHQLKLVRIRTK
jgi:hypothetical protein